MLQMACRIWVYYFFRHVTQLKLHQRALTELSLAVLVLWKTAGTSKKTFMTGMFITFQWQDVFFFFFLNLFQLQPEDAPPQIEEKVYCLCQQPNTNQPYAECSKCKDWFHHLCVGERSIEDIQLISPWLCPKCSSEILKQLKKKKTPRQLFAFF